MQPARLSAICDSNALHCNIFFESEIKLTKMKRRKFMLSTGLVGASTLLLGADVSSVLHHSSNWNYPVSLSVPEIEHIGEMADNLIPHLPEMMKNKKKFVRNMMEPHRILRSENDKNGYRTTFVNKNGTQVLIYRKAGLPVTKIIKN